jgi:hypothetical protein
MSITSSFPVGEELDRTLTFESFRQRRSNEEERAHQAKLDALQVWGGFACRVWGLRGWGCRGSKGHRVGSKEWKVVGGGKGQGIGVVRLGGVRE